jgi:elongation factor G
VAGQLVPVLVGSAFRNKGVQPLLDAVAAYLPSPLDLPPVTGRHPHTEREVTRRPNAGEPLAALVFKLVSDPFVGKLTFLRLYAGTLAAGSYVVNARTGKKERVARLLQMHADQREALPAASAGDIVAVVGLRDVRTGDTLHPEGHPIVLETVRFPEPVIGYAIEANAPPTPTSWGTRWAGCSTKTRRCTCGLRRKRGKPCSAAWASCTWKWP